MNTSRSEPTPYSSADGAARVLSTSSRFVVPAAAFVVAVAVFARAGERAGDWALPLAVVIPALGALGIWLLREGWHQLEDRRALVAFTSGKQPKTGAWAAAAGIARARDRPLVAPLSQRDALACTYRVTEKVRGAPAKVGRTRAQFIQRRYSGWHLVPMLIETERGNFEIGGFPDLLELEMSSLGASNVGRLGALATPPPGRATNAASAGLLVQPANELHLDWKLGDGSEDGRVEVKEWLLAPDEQVCVCGLFADGALRPHRSRPRGLPLYLGSGHDVLAQLSGEGRVYLLSGGTALLAAVVLVGWFVR